MNESSWAFDKEQNALARMSEAQNQQFARAMTAKIIPDEDDRDSGVIRRTVAGRTILTRAR